MISATGSPILSATDGTAASATTASVSTVPFAQQLEGALEQYLNQSANPSPLEIDIRPAESQVSGARQFLVTVQTPAASPSLQSGLTDSAPTPLVGAPAINSDQVPSAESVPTTPPENYVSVPFANGSTIVPTLALELATQNAMMQSPMMTSAAILNQDKASAAGDPMTGYAIPDTTLNWDDLTQDQQIAYLYASDYGLPSGQSMQQYLDSNLGPQIMANAPSSNPTLFGSA